MSVSTGVKSMIWQEVVVGREKTPTIRACEVAYFTPGAITASIHVLILKMSVS